MRKLEIEDADIMKIAIQQEIMRNDESRYDHRLHAILLICENMNSYEVGKLLGHSPRTIQYWVNDFNENGFAGLEEGERPGRPSKINSKILKLINRDLRLNPRDLGYQQNLWDGKLLSHHLEKAYNVHIGVRQCQRLFHKLGFRLRKPRPVSSKADEQKKEAFKKKDGN